MFNNVIVGVDGGPSGRDAISLARHIAARNGRLSLAYIYRGEVVLSRGTGGDFEASERARALALLESERADAGIEANLPIFGSPSVGRGLHELAEREHADLVVVGSSSRGLFGRVAIGDDTRAALNGARCAVAVAPAGYAGRSVLLGEIGVGYDGSPDSKQALAVAKALAAQLGAKVSAFEAVSIPVHAFHGDSDTVVELIHSYVDDARKRIASLGAEPHAAYGDPAEELALYGASVDLLIVGSRGYGPIGRLFHGSTSHQLARTARCPLLVLTRATADAAATTDQEQKPADTGPRTDGRPYFGR